ncbi:hypothetical protein [Aquimarina sp. 2201CG5-10]|uniref:hypothetical protein n=1 Tax=Aquimarina callyspongiae TaxID=3098150 RepID=UPI002AB56D6C|nr:hypothetical protein [Aquimarina sp. 2201CG5-10]MDY8134052.1 hypothetical protein [Aquimarina sp. 2201CG5-10]
MKAQKQLSNVFYQFLIITVIVISNTTTILGQNTLQSRITLVDSTITYSLNRTDSLFVKQKQSNNQVSSFYKTPLELTQEKNSTLRKKFRETKNWSKSIIWNSSPNWIRRLFS